VNRTPYAWTSLVLKFDLKWQCDGTGGGRTETVAGTRGSSDDPTEPFVQSYEELVIPLMGKVTGCIGEVAGVTLILAENDKYRVDGVTGKRVDFAKQAAAAAAAQRKRDAEKERKAAAERTVSRARCDEVYRATIHKKVVDLTVQESKQIQACEGLKMYPPE
jgi:hypothetical protein